MKPTVYIETSIVGYLTTPPSRDLVVAAHQQITRDWWENRRAEFDLCISQFVLAEAGAGNVQYAQERMKVVEGLPLLMATPQAFALARTFIDNGPLPPKAEIDALHLAIAAVSSINYLLTWNSKHIANAKMRPQIEALCRSAGYEPPVICTPEELMEE